MKLRNRILCWLWPELNYGLHERFTHEEIELIRKMMVVSGGLPRHSRTFNLLCQIRLKMLVLKEEK
jgi:hypothetical protein